MTEHAYAHLIVEHAAASIAPNLAPQARLVIDEDVFLIGRLATCQLPIDLREVSRQHAQIVSDGKRHYVVDLDSTNGTFLNGQALEPKQRHGLANGDLIQIATVLVLRFEDEGSTVPVVIPQPYLSGRFWLDSAQRQVYVNRRRLEPELTVQQFQLLELLASTPDRVISRDEVAIAVWPEAHGEVSEAMIDNLVARLRQRLASADAQHAFIETVRGIGYRFRIP
ncbi:MAG: FHA domain-containing protein [Candidatus Promineifilaceae bacterium]